MYGTRLTLNFHSSRRTTSEAHLYEMSCDVSRGCPVERRLHVVPGHARVHVARAQVRRPPRGALVARHLLLVDAQLRGEVAQRLRQSAPDLRDALADRGHGRPQHIRCGHGPVVVSRALFLVALRRLLRLLTGCVSEPKQLHDCKGNPTCRSAGDSSSYLSSAQLSPPPPLKRASRSPSPKRS